MFDGEPSTGLFALAGASESECCRRDVFCDDTSGCDQSIVTDFHWRNENRVGANESSFSNDGAMLEHAVVIAGARTCANIGARGD